MKSLHPNIDDLQAVSSSATEDPSTTRREQLYLQKKMNSTLQMKMIGMTVFPIIIRIIIIIIIIIIVAAITFIFGSVVTNNMRSKDVSSSLVNGSESVVKVSNDPYEQSFIMTEFDEGNGHTTAHTIVDYSDTSQSHATATATHYSIHTTTTPTQRHLTLANESIQRNLQQQLSFRLGDLAVTIPGLGIKVCSGMQVRVIARAGQKVPLSNKGSSKFPFHSMPDGAAILPSGNGNGYVYVSNSEMKSSRGGVYGLYFSNSGHVVDYKPLLLGSTRNCGGGLTPWNTWISCEEYGNGQCWQIDPTSRNPPKITQLGGSKGGNYESVAVDNRNMSRPIFFITEDAEFGALRRYTPPPPPAGVQSSITAKWNTLHRLGGSTDYLLFLDNNHFKWTTNEKEGRNSQFQNYRNVEGIDFHNGHLYFVSKKLYKMFILDLDNGTYTASSTKFSGATAGQFLDTPDQIIWNENGGNKYIYLTEDGGNTVGVYAICRRTGERYAIFEAYNGNYKGDETTGLAFSPDGRKMYVAFQDCGCKNSESGIDPNCGCLLEFSRKDGLSFDGSKLDIKFHSS